MGLATLLSLGRAIVAVAIPVAVGVALASISQPALRQSLASLAAWALAAAALGTSGVVVRSHLTNAWLRTLRGRIEIGLLYGRMPAALRSAGELSMRLTTDAGTLVSNVVGAVIEMPLAAATIVLVGIYAWHTNVALTVAILAPVPAYFLLPVLLGRRAAWRTEVARQAQGRALTRAIGTTLLADVLKVIPRPASYQPGGDWRAVAAKRISEQFFAGMANASQGWLQSLVLVYCLAN